MPLPQFWRVIGFNNTGKTVTFNAGGRLNLKITGTFEDHTSGKIDYTPLSDDDFGLTTAGSVANGAEKKTSVVDNTSTLYTGAQVQVELTHDEGAAAVGPFDLYLDGGDAAAELASDASGYDNAQINQLRKIGSLRWHSFGVDDQIMRSEVFNI